VQWLAEVASNSAAPVKIVEFFDYQCPFCVATIPALEEALRSYRGKIQLVLKNTPLSIHPDSLLAHQAAMAAGEQGKFWEMHALLFANQKKLRPADLLQYARQLNLDLPRFQNRLQSRYYEAAVKQDLALADALGVNGTPTFFINGQKLEGEQTAERFKRVINAALDPRGSAAEVRPAEQIQAVKQLDLSHAPVLGSPDAPVTIIEFSDMQCPFCAAASPTVHELIKMYPGQVKWVFKNFPLDFHEDSPLAHRALLAAGRQGKFWEMHDLVFSDQRNIKRDDLLQKARNLNLDLTSFRADLDSAQLTQLVAADIKEGAGLRVSGTPTFYINGEEFSGNMSLSKFQAIIEKKMPEKATQHVPSGEAAREHEITTGPDNAPVVLTWFSDLQSNLSLKATLQIRELMNKHPGKIRLVFRNRPLETHAGAMKLHEAALAANAQGKFWQMHDLIIANPQKDDKQTLLSYASRLGLDMKRFEAELDGHAYRPIVEQDLTEARRRAVLGTPVFFINSVRVDGLQSQKMIEEIVADQLAGKIQANSR